MAVTQAGRLDISKAERRQYRDEGYFLLPRVLDDAELAMLRVECARATAFIDARMDARGVDTIGLNHRGRRYVVPLQYKLSDALPGFLFGEKMAAVCRATLGGDAYLFLEQFVIKGAREGMELGWHQDAGYLPFDPPPYVTAWIPLDDVDEANGTVFMLPYGRAGTRARIPHRQQAGTNDKIGYFGPDEGVPVAAPAGAMAVFSSTTLHRSGPNRTDKPRRAYIIQYSAEPIREPDGRLRHFADPFLTDGERAPQPSPDALKRHPPMPWTWED